MSKSSGFTKLLVGAGIGVGLGLLFAPKKGEETRKDLKKKLDDCLEKVKNIDAGDVKESLEQKLEDLKMELADLDKEKVLALAKEKAQLIAKKADELVDLAVEKGTPVVEKSAKELRKNTASVLKKIVAKLEEEPNTKKITTKKAVKKEK